MNNKILRKAETYRKTHTKKQWLYRGLSVLAAGAVFCTTYALILPAITMESGTLEHRHDESCYAYTAETKVFACTALPHEHTDECWDAEGNPICGYVDYFVHSHDESCYDEEGTLLCELPEIGIHEHGEECFEPEEILLHEHTDECIGMEQGELICEIKESEGHVHDDTCIGVVSETLICELPEAEPHGHTAECYEIIPTDELICTEQEVEAHSHSESCYETVINNICGMEESEEHPHEDSCFEESIEMICILDETEGHTHSEECYSTEEILICEAEETEGHTHGESCYEIVTDNTCGQEEAEAHQHEDSCYEWTEILLCEAEAPEEEPPAEEETEPICGFDEVILHTHEEECFDEDGTWVCGMVEVLEHQHGEECYAVEITEYEEPMLICELEEYYRTAEDCAAEFAELVNTLPDPEDEEYYDAYYTAFDAYAMAFDLYCEEHPEMEGQEEFDAWLDELGYYDEYEYFAAMPDPNDITVYGTQASPQANAHSTTDIDTATKAASNITIKMFNYDSSINYTDDNFTSLLPHAPYFFFRGSAGVDYDASHVVSSNVQSNYDVDGYTEDHATVANELGADKYPVLSLAKHDAYTSDTTAQSIAKENDLSLGYLFGKNDNTHSVTTYDNITNTLFKYDPVTNQYTYSSAENAVDFDTANQKFYVREYVERSETTAGYGYKVNETTTTYPYHDFHPFTYWDGKLATDTSGRDYNFTAANVDYWFGMTMETTFVMPKDGMIDENTPMQFTFSGDDDVWVFIDDVLVLDLGGTHGIVTGSIDFSTGEIKQYLDWTTSNESSSGTSFPTTLWKCFNKEDVTKQPNGGWNDDNSTFADYTTHTIKFFYLERACGAANCSLQFNLLTIPENSLTIEKNVTVNDETGIADSLADELVNSLEYKFRVMEVDSDGAVTDNSLFNEDDTFKIGNENVNVGANGIITLRSGQKAVFDKLLENHPGFAGMKFVVEELLAEDLLDQYSKVYAGTLELTQGQTTYTDPATNITYHRLQSDIYTINEDEDKEGTFYSVFDNEINISNLSTLRITKEKASGSSYDESADDAIFEMQVKLGGELIPAGTEYTILDALTGNLISDNTVQNDNGIIQLKVGQTAEISGIISGTQYSVEELDYTEKGYTVSYRGSMTYMQKTQERFEAITDIVGETGEFKLASVVDVFVTNADYDFSVMIPLTKEVYGLAEGESAAFSFTMTPCDENGNTEGNTTSEASNIIRVLGDPDDDGKTTTTGEYFVIGYTSTAAEDGTYYYLIQEASASGYICDESEYIIAVTIETDSNGNKTANYTVDEAELIFINYKTATLTVTKTVTGSTSEGEFPFTVAMADFNGYTCDDKAFPLSNGGSVTLTYPIGASVTVTETENAGYITSYIIGDDGAPIYSTTAENITIDANGVTVRYTNKAGTELPSTGGIGTFPYTLGGLMIVGASAILFMYKTRRRQRG